MKKRSCGRPSGSAALAGVVFLCIALSALTGCEDDPVLGGENKITSFKIGNTSGAVDEVAQAVSITVPADEDVAALQPEVTVSENASVNPESGETVDITYPVSYTVTAENGVTRTYTVTVTKEQAARLETIEVTTLKSDYAYGGELDPAGIVVRGYYSDGTDKIELAADYTVTGYDAEKSGSQKLLVTLNGKTATFQVTVGSKPEERDISVTIGLPNTNKEPEIFGIPEGGIKLSASQSNNLPDEIVISAAGTGVYSSVTWYIDGSYPTYTNIITIEAASYTLKIPHYITFVGTKDGVEYSRTIEFTVEQ
jgi:hypothetical protein